VGVHPSTGGPKATRPADHGLAGRVLETDGGAPAVRLAVWRFQAGRIDGIDVAGQVVITVRAGTAVLLLDESARPEQVLALFDAFCVRLGSNAGWHSSQLPIDVSSDADLLEVEIPGRLHMVTRRRASALVADISLSLSEHGLNWGAERVPVTEREFAWTLPSAEHGGDR
jgi:hypothetical protein